MTPDGLRIWITNNIGVIQEAHESAKRRGTLVIPMIDLEGPGAIGELDRRD
jgi:hypothetical protein